MAKDKGNTALAPAASTAMAIPDYMKQGDRRGTENLASADVRPPALRLAQSMSPETKRSEPAFIDGLREGDLFNSITQEIYGDKAMEILVINSLGHRNVEFDPTNKGQVIDFNVPDGDPRTEFTDEVRDGQKVRVRPRATKFYDYLVLLLLEDGRREVATLSLKGTQLKKAVTLNTLIKMSNLPSFAHRIALTPVPEKKGSYSYYGYRVAKVGYASEADYQAAEKLFAEMSGKTVQLDTEVDPLEDGPDRGNEFA